MEPSIRRRPPRPPRVPAIALAFLVVCTLAAIAPASTDATTYVRVSSLGAATRVDRIVIARVKIDLPILHGVLDAPIRERVAYHYPRTSWPGGGSNTYLYGHARVGSFLNLKYLKKGDIVQLRLAKGGWIRYRVTSVRRVKWDDGSWVLSTKSERLTLQTCTSYTKRADRLVVLAVPVA
jgi:LPXTG-site transpeptidase (sortase) family protein